MKLLVSSVSAICTLLISNSSVESIRISGQADISLVIHSGPFHHSVRVERVVGSAPCEMRSAGLSAVGTYRQVTDEVYSWMKETRLATNVFHRLEGDCIHFRTMEESVHM